MATLSKFEIFVEDVANGVHNLGTDNLRLALTNNTNAPSASLDAVLTDIVQIAYTNLSGDPTSRDITIASSTQTGGTYTLVASDQTLSATGTMAAFQHIVVFNEGTTGKVDPLIGWYDYGSELTLNNGESLTIDYGANGAGNGNILSIV